MNDDGAFILAETHRKTSGLLFIDTIFIIDSDEFGRCFSHVLHWHVFKKTDKNVTEQLTCNSVLAQIFLVLGAASSCSTF